MSDTSRPHEDSQERQQVPEGRETPVMGPRRARKKVRPLSGEPGVARPYDPGTEKKRADEDPWQDPGGPEPANG